MLKVLSLGAGVQSSTVLLMSCAGELPRLDAAIFADTGWEPQAVYDYLEGVLMPAAEAADIKLVVTRKEGAITERLDLLPLFLTNADGSPGMVHRQCTSRYKVEPVRWATRDLLGVSRQGAIPAGAVEQWFGISWDESHRMRDPDVKFITNKYPLVELEMDRAACEAWLKRNGYPKAPKSACIGCPYRSDNQWLTIKSDPGAWAEAVDADRSLRDGRLSSQRRGGSLRGTAYLHSARIPLEDVSLANENQESLFGEECAGVCGV